MAIVIIHASCSKKHPFEYKQLILQPGPDAKDEGQDCLVAFRETDNDLYASSNHSGNPDVAAIRWTYNADNAGEGTNRTYIKFIRLSEIPSEAEIVAAKLSKKLIVLLHRYWPNVARGRSCFSLSRCWG